MMTSSLLRLLPSLPSHVEKSSLPSTKRGALAECGQVDEAGGGLTIPLAIDGKPQFADTESALDCSGFRITGQIAHEDYFVVVSHKCRSG